ncbi:SDR family oxidoreductase [Zhouia sp. PK063]|uniref:SDR family oxidoreductase n=1 Tax=Zhouia sp. PK063 TaxID=3373602 RepID=UPI00378B30F7
MKHVIVTGTSRGIGLELVKLLSKNDCKVLALSRNDVAVNNLKLENVTAFTFDLANEDSFKKVSEFINNEWNAKLDILINNAGKIVNKPFAQISFSEFEEVYKVNVFGVAELIKTCLPFMNSHSHVVTISSMGGIQGSVKFPGLAAYSSSKGAVITLMELLAEEYKEHKISFNTLALGAVQTEMLAEAFPGYKAPLKPLEMAEYIYNFALTGQKFYNGKVLQVSSTTP